MTEEADWSNENNDNRPVGETVVTPTTVLESKKESGERIII